MITKPVSQSLERVAAPLDGLRSMLLRLVGRMLRPWILDRERRVVAFALLSFSVSFVATALIPWILLAFGPLLLGLPHLLSDFRYLVFRPRLHREEGIVLYVAVPLGLLLIFQQPTIGLVASLGAVLLVPSSLRRNVVAALVLGCIALAYSFSYPVALFIAHFHNFVAVALWCFWGQRRGFGARWKPLLLFVLCYVLILCGALDGLVSGWENGLLFELSQTLAYGASPKWASRWVLSFAFAQSVHYSIWLRMIPEEDRERSTPRTWSASLQALVADTNLWVVMATLLGVFVLCGAAFVDLSWARSSYLVLVSFHAYLEFAVIAALCAGRQQVSSSPSCGARS